MFKNKTATTVCHLIYSFESVFYPASWNGRLGICICNDLQKIYNTLFLFVKLGREVNAFSFINHFLLTSHSLMLELDVVEFVLEFRVLGARSRLKNTMTLLKMRFIKIKI